MYLCFDIISNIKNNEKENICKSRKYKQIFV